MVVHLLALDASVRSYDGDGRLRVAMAPISKAAVNPYLGREIPNSDALGLDPETIYYLLRDPDELARAASTFNGVPILLKHEVVSAADPKRDIVVGSAGSDAAFDGTYLKNSLSIWDGEAIQLIESGEQKELSSAYRFDPDMTPGFYRGARYHGVMRNLKANHIALVKQGRAGSDVVVGDAALRRMGKDNRMAKLLRTAMDSEGSLMSTVLDFLQSRLDPDQLKELAEMLNTFGSTNTDEEGSQAQAGVEQLMKARDDMASAGVPVDPTAMDAAAIYRGALARMNLAMDGLPPEVLRNVPVLRTIFKTKMKQRTAAVPTVMTGDFEKRFPAAAKVSLGRQSRFSR